MREYIIKKIIALAQEARECGEENAASVLNILVGSMYTDFDDVFAATCQEEAEGMLEAMDMLGNEPVLLN